MTRKKCDIVDTPDYAAFVESAIHHAASFLTFQLHRYNYRRRTADIALFWCDVRETNREVLISMARTGWAPAHDLLIEMAAFLTQIGDPLPLWLQGYIVETARAGKPSRRRGKNPVARMTQDIMIAGAVKAVAESHRIRCTRNPGTERESACSIISKALAGLGAPMSESRVVSIWQKYERAPNGEAGPAWRVVLGAFERQGAPRHRLDTLVMTADRYGHLFPSQDDAEVLAAGERALTDA